MAATPGVPKKRILLGLLVGVLEKSFKLKCAIGCPIRRAVRNIFMFDTRSMIVIRYDLMVNLSMELV